MCHNFFKLLVNIDVSMYVVCVSEASCQSCDFPLSMSYGYVCPTVLPVCKVSLQNNSVFV